MAKISSFLKSTMIYNITDIIILITVDSPNNKYRLMKDYLYGKLKITFW